MVLSAVGLVAIVVWALWEIASGINVFRRLLGLVILALVLINRF